MQPAGAKEGAVLVHMQSSLHPVPHRPLPFPRNGVAAPLPALQEGVAWLGGLCAARWTPRI